MFATAMNLLPIAQLDGGHILYAFFPNRHRIVSRLFCLLMLPLGWFWFGWFVLGNGAALVGAGIRWFTTRPRSASAGANWDGSRSQSSCSASPALLGTGGL